MTERWEEIKAEKDARVMAEMHAVLCNFCVKKLMKTLNAEDAREVRIAMLEGPGPDSRLFEIVQRHVEAA